MLGCVVVAEKMAEGSGPNLAEGVYEEVLDDPRASVENSQKKH